MEHLIKFALVIVILGGSLLATMQWLTGMPLFTNLLALIGGA
jgi:hypothetical protein